MSKAKQQQQPIDLCRINTTIQTLDQQNVENMYLNNNKR